MSAPSPASPSSPGVRRNVRGRQHPGRGDEAGAAAVGEGSSVIQSVHQYLANFGDEANFADDMDQ